MAKRKRGTKVQEPTGPNMDVGSLRKRINTFEDVADSDDEFHLQRDRVLLDEAPEAKRRRKVEEREEFLEMSDEEVLDYSEPEEEEEDEENEVGMEQPAGAADDSEDDRAQDDEEDEEGWGTTKADLYGADEIETEEQALAEEAEALRLQKKQLQAMSAADYGFDETDWQAKPTADEDEKEAFVEHLPQLQIQPDMSPAERLKLLKLRYPEFEPLRKELLALQDVHTALVVEAKGGHVNAVTKLRAAGAYLGALTMYFALLTSPAESKEQAVVAMPAKQLRDHPVMDVLVRCRDVWNKAKALPTPMAPAVQEVDVPAIDTSTIGVPKRSKFATGNSAEHSVRPPRKASRAELHAQAAQAAADARKAERLAKTEAGLADLDALLGSSTTARKSKTKIMITDRDDVSDLGEEAPLTAREAAEKALRKKSLRFYTAQIAQKANKRGASGRNAGGDEDVPHRERLRDRQTRLNAEAEKRGKKPADVGAELGGDSGDEDDAKVAKDVRGETAGNDEDEYYDLVASRTAKKKSEKLALAAAQKQAALTPGAYVLPQETVGEDGKRKISYLIEKNKGLTPHRKKDVRNPRVKKRKKYDEKKKKLASMKPTYKGGEAKGGYGGEMTGIKSGLVKSTRL